MIYKTIDILGAPVTFYFLDSYEDINPNRKRPMIIICPGGGYRFCSNREAESIAICFNSFGFNCAVLKYTCNADGSNLKEPLFPLPLQQLASSVSYVRQHAAELNTNADMIATLGFSAGGHLVASLGCFWKDYGLSCRPDAQVLCYPVITSGKFAHKGSFDKLCVNNDVLQQKLSLENCVNADVPATFIWHTRTDEGVPVENSLLFVEALDRFNVPYELKLFDHGEHGMSLANDEVKSAKHPTADKEIATWPNLVKDWLFTRFGNAWW